MKKMIVSLSVFAMLIGLCACQKTPASTDPTQTTTTPTQTQPSDPKPVETLPTQPVDPRIAEMQALLEYKGTNNDFYNFALTSEFASPADVNLRELFYYGFQGESRRPSDEEITYLDGRLGQPWEPSKGLEFIRLPVDRMNEVLTDVFGITLAQTNYVGLDDLIYLEQTDCYYSVKTHMPSVAVRVESVKDQEDGTIQVYYRRGNNPSVDMIVTLKPVGEKYQILSNLCTNKVGEMQVLLEWPSENQFYNYALTSEYETPADVNLLELFKNGFQEESDDPTEEEIVLLDGKLGTYWQEYDLARLPVEKMDAVLTELFGITLEQTNGVGLEYLTYLEETNCYYTANTGVYYADITVVYVETLDDGSLMVQYATPYNGDFMVKLMPSDDGGYRFLSNTEIPAIYNKRAIRDASSAYFEQREAYLLGKSEIIGNTNPGIVPDEAKHREAIAKSGVEWLQSDITIDSVGCWDSHAEAIVTEVIAYRVDGITLKETIVHNLQLGLTDDGSILVVGDGYFEKATGFKSCSYVPPKDVI